MPTVTIDDLKELWSGAIVQINRGDEYSPITQEDLYALANGCDLDDDGRPEEGDWQVLADQFNSDEPGELTGGSDQHIAVQDLAAARRRLAEVKAEQAATKTRSASLRLAVVDAKDELDQAIQTALNAGVPVTTIAAEADLSVPRIYQICDGRR
ncbi:hypothetical protein [Frankia sp. AgW1.1]|uniref:hypothetical protein n=1 Tax=Frankia sp. AgW1.1 TaxID=1836971 RepID=UPI0019322983|nr:hypothetical protein [Frankia sp. AgW1.1]MBL7487068.1 hypothetical protein [Frankia sp. AgW1.1]